MSQEAASTKSKYILKSAGGGTYKVGGGQQLAVCFAHTSSIWLEYTELDVYPAKVQVATAAPQALLRFGSGAFVSGKLSQFRNRPAKPIELYEFEGCPFCRSCSSSVCGWKM